MVCDMEVDDEMVKDAKEDSNCKSTFSPTKSAPSKNVGRRRRRAVFNADQKGQKQTKRARALSLSLFLSLQQVLIFKIYKQP